jgi:hypothetical protein
MVVVCAVKEDLRYMPGTLSVQGTEVTYEYHSISGLQDFTQ